MSGGKVMLAVMGVDGWVRAELTGRIVEGFMALNPRDVYLMCVIGARPVATARYGATTEFLKNDCEWLVMVDHDTVPPANFLKIIPMMEESEDKFIAALPTPMAPYVPALYENPSFNVGWVNDGIWQLANRFSPGWNGDYDFLGGACLITHRTVFEKVPEPWFKMLLNLDDLLKPEIEQLSGASCEDLYFTQKAKQAGFRLWIHSDFICSHFKVVDLLQTMQAFQSRPRSTMP
jgi:hypothetical protein